MTWCITINIKYINVKKLRSEGINIPFHRIVYRMGRICGKNIKIESGLRFLSVIRFFSLRTTFLTLLLMVFHVPSNFGLNYVIWVWAHNSILFWVRHQLTLDFRWKGLKTCFLSECLTMSDRVLHVPDTFCQSKLDGQAWMKLSVILLYSSLC